MKDKKEKSRIIKDKLLKNPKILESKNILIYVSLSEEVETKELIEELLKLKKLVYTPRIVSNYIEFYQITSLLDLKPGKFNILEPIGEKKFINFSSCCIIVPGLLFDKSNNRLGYGGGYYDKYLENKKIYKIGICFHDLLIDKLETLSHDIKMDLVITER